jgi:hypothetical protein
MQGFSRPDVFRKSKYLGNYVKKCLIEKNLELYAATDVRLARSDTGYHKV